MVLCEIAHHAGITEQLAQIAAGEHEIESIGCVGFLDHPELAVKVGQLTLHQSHLVISDTLDPLRALPAPSAVCAMRPQETILRRLGRTLHVHMDEITHEPLPSRWVELILYLEEEEQRSRTDKAQAEAEPQR